MLVHQSSYPVAQVVSGMQRTSRKNRRPKHTFQVRARPWDIQPFVIAPVIPGETLTSALYQSRVVTDPIKNPLIGWWTEYYWFYVKLRDLNLRDQFVEMMLDPAAPTTGLNSAAKVPTYHGSAAEPDYVQMCLERVVEEYFRDEGEGYAGKANAGVISGMPIAKAVGPRSNFLDSAELDTVLAARDDNPLQNPDDNVQYQKYQEAYDRMRQARMIDMTFEDWLETFGVRLRSDEHEHIPELLRMHRDWQYPSNTVEPTTGIPSSAVSWAVADRIDKDRYFKEPGFIFGVTIARPKIYMSGQKSTAVGMLNTAESWMPALLGDQPWTSLRKFAATAGPVPAGTSPTGDYWIDLRDLFMYGDQFVNFALTETNAGLVALPKAGMQKHYVNAADRTALFQGAAELVRQDGVVDFTIKGPPLTTVDHT